VLLQPWQFSATAALKKKRVLYLGDSMSMGAFGTTLDHEMRAAGFDVYTFVAGGATPYYWLSRYSTINGPIGYWEKTPRSERRQNITSAVPKIESLLERYDPDVVVVQTGTNLYSALRSKRRSKADNVKEVEGLLNHMVEAATQGGRKCYWITPPEAHPDRYPTELQAELAELTKRVVGREAKVFDSRKVTSYTDPYPTNDGIHYGATEARQWANFVANDFRQFMAVEGRTPQGIFASNKERKANTTSPEKYANIPRAIPVASVKSRSSAERIPIKQVPARELAEAAAEELVPPTRQQEPTGQQIRTEMEERPLVQYVKKAVAVETEGVEWGELDLEVRLVAKSELKSLKDIDYSYCFVMNEYEVVKVNSGYYPYPHIRIARVVMWGKKLCQSAIDEPIGSSPDGGWKLVPMSRYPRFEQMQMVEELPYQAELPIYIIAFE
jgi:hypothetical protein